jgi:serine/threonine protein kinase
MSPASTTARVTASHPAGEGLEGLVLSDTYLLGDILARGGMGVLYAAEHTRLRTPLVVKVLRQRYASHPIARARFEREALATARLDAAHVLRVVDLVETPDGRPAVVTERLTGEDLQQHLSRRKTLPVPLALDIVRQVLRGLEAAHAAHVIHRDIKPSNIFLSPSEGSPHVRVLDFGVAKLEDAAGITKAGAVVGTPAYMPPEQAAGRPVDARGDVYSTGAVLYRMLSGRSPYSGDADSVLRSVLSGPPAPLAKVAPELPEKVSALVERAMMRDPEARFASASEMLRAIDAIEPSGAKPVAKRSLPRVRSYQRARLRGGLTLAMGLLFVGAVAFGTLAREVSLRVPLALAYGALGGAWVAALRQAYRRCAESPLALEEWALARGEALTRGLAVLGGLALARSFGGPVPVAVDALALAPLLVTELQEWWRARNAV